MRNLEQIIADQKDNDALLLKAQRRKEALDEELHEMYGAVMAAMGRGKATGPVEREIDYYEGNRG